MSGDTKHQCNEIVSRIARAGGTPLVVAKNKKILGVIYLKDIIKPGINAKLNFDQYDYIDEFGKALNATIAEVLKMEAPAPQRVNAARMLVLAAKSGAPAHAA